MNEKQISIVIVNYNVKDLLLACLKSLYQFLPTSVSIEIIVVDNHSSDNSVEAIKNTFPEVIVIANHTNVGFPAANNQAFKIAKGDFFFMLNPDTALFDDSFVKLYDYLKENKEVDLVAPMLLNSDKSRQSNIWRFPTLWYLFCEMNHLSFLIGKKAYSDKDYSQIAEVESCSGAAILFRKSVLDKIGMLDETMFWIEDIEFCYRASLNNLKLVYFPQTQIIHHIGQSAKKNYNISISNQMFNKIKFFKKYHSAFAYVLVVLMSLIHVFIKLLVFGLLSPFNVIYFRKAKAYLYTLPRLFNPPKGIK